MLTNYITNNTWTSFKNNNRSLFYRSIYTYGIIKYKHPKIQNIITEDLTIYYPNNTNQIRAFNGNMPPLSKKTLKNFKVEDIVLLIKDYYNIRTQIKELESKIELTKDYLNNKALKSIIELEANIYAYEYLISNLSNFFNLNNFKESLLSFMKWKNDPNNKESIIYNKTFTKIVLNLNLEISISELKNYLTYKELLAILSNKLSKEKILNIIETRKKGFIFLNLQNNHGKILTNKNTYNKIKIFFEDIINQELELSLNNNYIVGKPTYSFKELIGEALIYNSKTPQDVLNKILICEVLTASDTYKLIDAKAFIVDSGGILSHAAIFSREFNKPCIVGCKIATKYFKNGDKIKINGLNGTCTKINN